VPGRQGWCRQKHWNEEIARIIFYCNFISAIDHDLEFGFADETYRARFAFKRVGVEVGRCIADRKCFADLVGRGNDLLACKNWNYNRCAAAATTGGECESGKAQCCFGCCVESHVSLEKR